MKRFAFALSLVAATAFAAPLAAQGPWYDPSGRGQRTDQGRVDRNGNIYNGGVYQDGRYDVPTDGRWHKMGTDRQGRTIYVRERYDSNGNLIREAATRNWLGHYSVIDSRVISYARNNGRYDRNGTYGNNGRYDSRGRDRNDRWDQNNGHDNGRHNGWYKNKNKNRGNDRYDRQDRRDRDHDEDDDRDN